MASDYKDARRWPGKASIADGTSQALKEQLNRVTDLLEAGKEAHSSGDYTTAREKVEEALQLSQDLVDASGWSSSGYDYNKRFENESLPAMERLLEEYKEQEEVSNL